MHITGGHAASNPILGSGHFVPDVEAHVWQDGRVYLYGSYDLQGRMEYCSDSYHVFSSDNLVDWVDHGVSFSLSDTAWAKDLGALYAPDCAYRDGTYYLYYCVPDGRCGVAVSASPCGPFKDVGPIAHVHGIDPAVLVDDDGSAYLYWGQFDQVRAARLRDNMTEIDPQTITQPLSVREHAFHEGSSVKKIGGKYYYLFTDTHRHGGRATCLGYAVSDHPTTGFRWGGMVVDNFGCDQETWNNHGSLCRIGETWYVFYHRSTHASRYSRWVCAEPVSFGPDGSIREVRMTTSGMGAPLRAGEKTFAWRACERSGHARVDTDRNAEEGLSLSGIHPGDTALYRSFQFAGEGRMAVRLRSEGLCRVEAYADGWYLGCAERDTGGVYRMLSVQMPALKGIHEISLRFYGTFEEAAADWFCFSENN